MNPMGKWRQMAEVSKAGGQATQSADDVSVPEAAERAPQSLDVSTPKPEDAEPPKVDPKKLLREELIGLYLNGANTRQALGTLHAALEASQNSQTNAPKSHGPSSHSHSGG